MVRQYSNHLESYDVKIAPGDQLIKLFYFPQNCSKTHHSRRQTFSVVIHLWMTRVHQFWSRVGRAREACQWGQRTHAIPPSSEVKHPESFTAMQLWTYGCVAHDLDEVAIDEGSLRRLGTAEGFPRGLCFPPYSEFQALIFYKNTSITSVIGL